MTHYYMTFAEMQTELASNRFLNDADHRVYSAAQLQTELNRANNELLDVWNDRSGGDITVKDAPSITTEAGVQEYNLPADFGTYKKGYPYIQTGDNSLDYKELFPVEYAESYIRYTGDQQEEPESYCIVGSYGKTTSGGVQTITYPKLRLFPTPDSAYVIAGKYSPITPEKMTADSDISQVPANFHDLVVLLAGINIAQMKGFTDLMKVWGLRYEIRLDSFRQFCRARIRPNEPHFKDVFYG